MDLCTSTWQEAPAECAICLVPLETCQAACSSPPGVWGSFCLRFGENWVWGGFGVPQSSLHLFVSRAIGPTNSQSVYLGIYEESLILGRSSIVQPHPRKMIAFLSPVSILSNMMMLLHHFWKSSCILGFPRKWGCTCSGIRGLGVLAPLPPLPQK